jgi:hypothetical protein
MILTFPQFQNLWQQHFAVFQPNINPHNLYQSYLTRENCLEDFLDIFRGYDTRVQRQQNNNLPHRFQHLFNSNYTINYILIAEAAPFGENYIYLNGTGSYITAPLNAFNVNNVRNLNTTDRLAQLAATGVVILDLFPFNLQFNLNQGFLRNQLILNNTTLNYLIDFNNVYSVINRVNYLINNIQNCNLQNVINTAFMATPLINNYLSANFPNIPGNPLLIQNGLNQIIGNQIQNNSGSFYNMGNLTGVPQYCAEGCAASGSPHATLIRNALNL